MVLFASLVQIAVLAALLIGAAAALWGLLEARAANVELEHQRDAAKQSEAKALDEAYKAKRVRDFFAGMFTASDPSRSGRDVRVVDILDRSARRIELDLAEDRELLASYGAAIGQSYLGLGLLSEAEEHLETALEHCREAQHTRHLQ